MADEPPSSRPFVLIPFTTSNEPASAISRRREADTLAPTAQSVERALRERGYRTQCLPITRGLSPLARRLRAGDVYAVFNLVDSIGGEDRREPEVPSLCRARGVPCTGADATALEIALRKESLRLLMASAQVPTPSSTVYRMAVDEPPGFPGPWFVKPAHSDGSIGIDQGSVVHDEASLAARVALVSEHFGDPVLVEEYLPGPELSVACFGEIEAVTVMDFSRHPAGCWPIVTYACKWVESSVEYAGRSIPAEGVVDERLIETARHHARQALSAIGARGPARVDLRVDARGALAVIDINPNPDLDPDAGFARAMRGRGLGYADLVDAMVRAALSSPGRHADTNAA